MRRKDFTPTPVDLLKGEIKSKRIDLKLVAKKAGFTRALVYKVITCERKNPEVRKALAEALGKYPRDIWPDYYQPSV